MILLRFPPSSLSLSQSTSTRAHARTQYYITNYPSTVCNYKWSYTVITNTSVRCYVADMWIFNTALFSADICVKMSEQG